MRISLFVLPCLLAGLTFAFAAEPPPDHEESVCRTNLLLLHDAIMNYRAKSGGELPGSLSDLTPTYLADTAVLQCPKAVAAGVTSIALTGRKDVREAKTATYFYEFHAAPLKSPRGRTNRDWKMAQMRVVGGDLPMVRCFNHGPVLNRLDRAVNLGFNGRIYVTGLMWEEEFRHLVPAHELTAQRLLEGEVSTRVVVVPPAPAGNAGTIDLSRFYNLSLIAPAPKLSGTLDLSPVPVGNSQLNGVLFDLRGAVQLAWKETPSGMFPSEIAAIPIGGWAKKLHFLHTTIGSVTNGYRLGEYVVQYTSGSNAIVSLVVGNQIGLADEVSKTGAAVAIDWENVPTGSRLSVHQFTWTNPNPEKPIVSIGIRAVNAGAGILLLGVSLEQ